VSVVRLGLYRNGGEADRKKLENDKSGNMLINEEAFVVYEIFEK
jgi:hypothetical protein